MTRPLMLRALLHRAPLLAGLWLVLAGVPFALAATDAKSLPEFRFSQPAAWLNSKPLRGADLRGKVVLIDLFTTG